MGTDQIWVKVLDTLKNFLSIELAFRLQSYPSEVQ